MVWSGGRKFEAFKELNNSASGLGATANMPASFPNTFYIRLVSTDGPGVQPQYSPDGVTWTNTGTAHEHDGAGGREDRHVRHGVDAVAARPVTRASFDWFKLTAPTAPSDEFDGEGLNTVPLERDRAP